MNPKPILDLIARYESETAAALQGVPDGYDVVFGGIPKKDRPARLTDMTAGEVLDWQRAVVRKGAASSAAGRYQIIRKTLESLDPDPSRRFDRACQDELGLALLKRRGWDEFASGRMPADKFADNLAREWASLPVQQDQKGGSRFVRRGQSYYAGDGLNRAHASCEGVLAALNECRGKPLPRAPEPPPIPEAQPAPATPVAVLVAAIVAVIGAAVVYLSK